jgi:integrase/recombinase XerD
MFVAPSATPQTLNQQREAKMGMPAKVLAPGELRRVQRRARRGRYGVRNSVMVLLSFKAGLRACEIAGLDWTMVLDPSGRIGKSLMIAGGIAKNGKPRRVPLHLELKAALQQLSQKHGRPRSGPVVLSERGGRMTAKSVVNWFKLLYHELELTGCSSHSGRRTFITLSARLVSRAGGSLRDVQELAGHSDLSTTQRYIEGDRDAQRKLVAML